MKRISSPISSFVLFCLVSLASTQVHGEIKLPVAKNSPWGKLIKTPIFLEAPDRLVNAYTHPSSTTNWEVSPRDLDALRGILEKSKLSATLWEPMFSADRLLKQAGLVVMFPAPALILALDAETRSSIYQLLSKVSENEYFASPLVITDDNPETWMHGSGLSPELAKWANQLVWRMGKRSYFSDVNFLMSQARNSADPLKIMKYMTRTESLVVEIELTSESDLEKLLSYWKLEGDMAEASSLFASLLPTKTGVTVRLDIAHLLPPNVRNLLYTYPTTSQGIIGRYPDCHWTSLNFAETANREYYIDTTAAVQELQNRYTQTTGTLRLGDVLLFRNGGEGLHSCVYIADDVVFSKNGSNLVHPWVLCTTQQVLETYHDIPNLQVDVMRRKSAEAAVTLAEK